MGSLLTFSSHYDNTVLNHMTEHSYNKFHIHKRQPVKLSGQIGRNEDQMNLKTKELKHLVHQRGFLTQDVMIFYGYKA